MVYTRYDFELMPEYLKVENQAASKIKWIVLLHDRSDDQNYAFWPYNYPGYGNLFPGATESQNTLGYSDEFYETSLLPSSKIDKSPKTSRP